MANVTKPASIVRIQDGMPVTSVPPPSMPKLGLSPLEEAAITGLVSGDGADYLVNHVRDRATAFATGDSAVRRRALARAAAVQDVQVQELSALLVAAVARRDLEAARLLDRLATSAVRRYRELVDQLRVESASSRRVSVVAQGLVAVTAEEGP